MINNAFTGINDILSDHSDHTLNFLRYLQDHNRRCCNDRLIYVLETKRAFMSLLRKDSVSHLNNCIRQRKKDDTGNQLKHNVEEGYLERRTRHTGCYHICERRQHYERNENQCSDRIEDEIDNCRTLRIIFCVQC